MRKLIRLGGFMLGVLFFCACSNSAEKEKAKTNAGLPSGTFMMPPNVQLVSESAEDSYHESPEVEVPEGMVLVPGGVTKIGSSTGMDWEKPEFWVKVKPFFMDVHPVTVAEFREFVKATAYVTEAEKFGNGGILDTTAHDWALRDGANWKYPQGPAFSAAKDDHPVTQVSWNDAQAYATWAGKRLPYEIEWEHAARNAENDQTNYPWGDDFTPNATYMANTWNGKFPQKNNNLDGFYYTSPVGFFGKTKLGLSDMSGNVWEWCQDWRYSYADIISAKPPMMTEKVMRGGSFLCEPGWCHGYRVSGRSFSTPETSLMHVGFRCVKDIEKK